MWVVTYVVICKNILFIVNQIINSFIISYEVSKSPLSRTILDDSIVDTCWIRTMGFTISWFYMNLVYFYGQVDFVIGQLLTFVWNSIFVCVIASYQATLVTKSILIFAPFLTEEITDTRFRKMSWFAILVYAASMALIDAVPDPKPLIILGILTGESEPT